jgi:hypothetical protein
MGGEMSELPDEHNETGHVLTAPAGRRPWLTPRVIVSRNNNSFEGGPPGNTAGTDFHNNNPGGTTTYAS